MKIDDLRNRTLRYLETNEKASVHGLTAVALGQPLAALQRALLELIADQQIEAFRHESRLLFRLVDKAEDPA